MTEEELTERRLQVIALLTTKKITTVAGMLPLDASVVDVSICCHSDTPV